MENYKFFTHTQCEYFPCHKFEKINCLFCMCPLYPFEDCGGNYTTLENGIKDCSDCILPHTEDGYDYIIDVLKMKYRKE